MKKAATDKNGLDVNSPSKPFIEYGKSVIEGLVVGISAANSRLKSSVQNAAKTAKDTMAGGLTGIKDAWNMDVDVNPKIRPVVDMTDVQSGIDSTFKKAPTIDVSATKMRASAVSTSYSTAASQKSPGEMIVDKSNNPTIQITQHNTVRNDTDIRKISQDLQHMVDRYAGAKGKVVVPV
jgi:hypothetical protein